MLALDVSEEELIKRLLNRGQAVAEAMIPTKLLSAAAFMNMKIKPSLLQITMENLK
jgi:hypothetical protein